MGARLVRDQLIVYNLRCVLVQKKVSADELPFSS